jgi:hypothetical protein
MTVMKSRVARLERTCRVHNRAESADETTIRRIYEVMELVPTETLRLVITGTDARTSGRQVATEQQQAIDQLWSLVEAGAGSA